MAMIKGNIVTNKNLCKIKQFALSFSFLSSEFLGTVLVTFDYVVFVTCVDRIFIKLMISLRIITQSTKIIFKYILSSQICVLGFQV